MPGNIRGGIFLRKAYFEVFANLNFHELPQFYCPLLILVDRSPAERTTLFVFESCVRRHHTCKDIWVPGNDADPYSVAMINSSMTVVGHGHLKIVLCVGLEQQNLA